MLLRGTMGRLDKHLGPDYIVLCDPKGCFVFHATGKVLMRFDKRLLKAG